MYVQGKGQGQNNPHCWDIEANEHLFDLVCWLPSVIRTTKVRDPPAKKKFFFVCRSQ